MIFNKIGAVIAVGLLFALLFLLSLHTLTSINQDIGRHLTLGKIIWETKEVPRTNLFSYTAPEFPFINHHWLGEVLLYLGSAVLGLKGLIVAKAAVLVAAFGLAFLAAYKNSIILPTLAVGLNSVFILIERTEVRPEILSFLFLSWYLFVLFKKSEDKRFLWSLPIVQLIWVNTHIYYFLGPLIFAFWFFTQRRHLPNRRLNIIIGALILAVNFANPFTWRGALSPLLLYQNYGYSIIENKSPFFLKAFSYPQLTTYALFFGLALVVLSFAANYRSFKQNLFGFFVIASAAAFSLIMVRNFPIFALAMLPVTMKNFSEAGWNNKNKIALAVTMMVLGSLIYAVVSDQIYARAGMGRKFGLDIPSGAQGGVDFVRRRSLKGPMFNNFDVGSFLICKMPEEKVFIDGRPEAYPADFIQNVYIKMQEDPALRLKYSEQYGINFIFWYYHDITPWSRTFLARIIKDPAWPLVYRDGSVMIFVRNTAANAALIRNFNPKSVK